MAGVNLVTHSEIEAKTGDAYRMRVLITPKILRSSSRLRISARICCPGASASSEKLDVERLDEKDSDPQSRIENA